MKKLMFLVLVIGMFSSCSDEVGNDNVNIRLSNISSTAFENIIVNTSTGNVDYGDLNPGAFSEYKNFEIAYRYAFIQLNCNGETYTLQPIDYVGEEPLKNGNYTYKLDFDDQDGLTFMLSKD